MAKQRGPRFIEGTYDGRTYYKRDGKYYSRKKSSLSRRRVKQTAAFQRTMEYAGWMAAASVIGSAVYWQLPEKERKRKRYQALTGEAMRLLRDGMDEVMVRAKLEAAHVREAIVSQVDVKPEVREVDLQPVVCSTDTKREEKLSTVTGTAAVTEGYFTALQADKTQEPISNQQSPAERTAVTAGIQRRYSLVKDGSISIIPTPAIRVRRPRVLRYKKNRQHTTVPQKRQKAVEGAG